MAMAVPCSSVVTSLPPSASTNHVRTNVSDVAEEHGERSPPRADAHPLPSAPIAASYSRLSMATCSLPRSSSRAHSQVLLQLSAPRSVARRGFSRREVATRNLCEQVARSPEGRDRSDDFDLVAPRRTNRGGWPKAPNLNPEAQPIFHLSLGFTYLDACLVAQKASRLAAMTSPSLLPEAA